MRLFFPTPTIGMKWVCMIPANSIPKDHRYFQHAHFIPKVGVGKERRIRFFLKKNQNAPRRSELVHGDLPRQHSFGTTLRFTGPVPAESRQ